MFLNKIKKESYQVDSVVNPKIIWIEIPATNLPRAVRFYEKVFHSKLKQQMIEDKSIAVFNEKETGIKGCIVEIKAPSLMGGIKPTFFVDVMCDALSLVEAYGGYIISHPILLKQKNEKGETLIGKNLIDHEIGYLSEITDSEGNTLFLYSHS